MKKAKMGNVTLKGDLHGLFKALGSVLSTMLKKPCKEEIQINGILPSYTELSSDF